MKNATQTSVARRPHRVSEYWHYLASKKWQTVRAEAFRRAGGLCELNYPGCTGKATEGHHWTYPAAMVDDVSSNVFAVCRQCHYEEHKQAIGSYDSLEQLELFSDNEAWLK